MDSVVVYACADLLVLFDEAHIFITRQVVVTLAGSYLDPVSYWRQIKVPVLVMFGNWLASGASKKEWEDSW